jgi:hypothetical protein
MAKDLAQLFARFEERASHLNTVSNSLSATINAAEDRLRESNLGLEIWLVRALAGQSVEGPAGTETSLVHRLGWAKIDGEWGLAVKTVRIERGFFEGDTSAPYMNEDWAGEPTSLSQASRALRIAALDQLPELIERMTEEAEDCISTIEGAERLVIK